MVAKQHLEGTLVGVGEDQAVSLFLSVDGHAWP